jgi:hypothetical protein
MVKSIEDFGRNRASNSGLTNYCRPCHNVVMAEGKQRLYGGQRNYLLQRRYRITAEQVEEQRRHQGGVCVICLRREATHVDHDHMTGLFRALLCFPCNGALGQYEDVPELMRESARYLEGVGSHSRSMLLEFGVLTIGGHARRLVDAGGRRVKRVGTRRDDRLRARYGIGQSQVQELLKMQQGRCAICCDREGEHVDHDHETGVVRGVLCGPCNTGMGQLGDDPVVLRRAADYVLGGLIRRVPADGGGARLSFTFPDVDPRKVPVDGWESYRARDGEHRKLFLQVEEELYVQTRLAMAPGERGFCLRHSFEGRRLSFAERFQALLDAPPSQLVTSG